MQARPAIALAWAIRGRSRHGPRAATPRRQCEWPLLRGGQLHRLRHLLELRSGPLPQRHPAGRGVAATGGGAEQRRALLALQACPVAAIGAPRELIARTPADGFPALITRTGQGEVYYCGWASRLSFGASSYLIVRPGGLEGASNVLIDSPASTAPSPVAWRPSAVWAACCSATAMMWPTTRPSPITSAASAGFTAPMPTPRRRRSIASRAANRSVSTPTCACCPVLVTPRVGGVSVRRPGAVQR